MFKKLSIALLVLIGAIGAYALSANLFPDTVSFPRIPTGTGAIGEVLSKLLGTTNIEGSDGTVQNAYTLSGVSARDYLHNTLCTTPGEVWLGVDTDGNPFCGIVGTTLAFGKITGYSGAVSVLHPDGSTSPVIWPNMLLEVGDIISTPSDGYATIGFNDDNSVLRLDADTIVELQIGTLGGNSVAEAILQDGSLWGRVLTNTGINFSAGGYVAGVRGTSISLEKAGTNVDVAIPHSRNAGVGAAGLLTCPQGTIGLSIGSALTITGGSLTCPTDTPTGSIANLYDNSWIRENTKKDIIMMNVDTYKIFSYGVSNNTQIQKELAISELSATMPTDLTTCQGLMNGESIVLSGSSYIDSINGGYMISYNPPTTVTSAIPLSNASCGDIIAQVSDTVKQKIMGCALENKSYWTAFDELPLSKCQDQHALAVANLTYAGAMYTKSGSIVEMGNSGISLPQMNSSGVFENPGYVNISSVGQYISFDTGTLATRIPGGLVGKTVTIKYTPSPLLNNNGQIFFGGGSCFLKWTGTSWYGNSLCMTTPISGTNSVSFKLTTTITDFRIGNNSAGTLPIGANIQSIIISN